jgi:hypothetical protein
MKGTDGIDHEGRECVACGEKGHWYSHCPNFDFIGSVWNALTSAPKPWVHPSDENGQQKRGNAEEAEERDVVNSGPSQSETRSPEKS